MQIQNSQQHSSSSISDGSELRYQKAVKQISKLINVNSNFRRQLDNYKQAITNLQQQNQALLRDSETLRRQRDFLQEKTKDMQYTIKKLEEKIQQNAENAYSEESVERIRRQCAEKIQQLEGKLDEQGYTIIRLEDIVGERQKENVELKNKIQIFEKQRNQDKQKFQRMKTQESKASHRQKPKCQNCQRIKQKQKKTAVWSAKLNEQNIELKKKLAWMRINIPNNNPPEVSFVNTGSFATRTRSLSATDLYRVNFHDRFRELETERKSQHLIFTKKIGRLEKKLKTRQLREKLTKGKEREETSQKKKV